MRSRVIGIVIGAAILIGGYAVTTGGPETANLWVNTAAGASPTRCSSACAYDSTKAYGSLGAAYAAAGNGDTIKVQASLAYGAQEIDYNSSLTQNEGSRVTITSATGAGVEFSSLTLGSSCGCVGGRIPNYLTVDGMNTPSLFVYIADGQTPSVGTHDTISNFNQAIKTSKPHTFGAQPTDNLTVSTSDFGWVCCSTDAFNTGMARSTDPDPANMTLDHVTIHDVQELCSNLPASYTSQGWSCAANNGTHVDGFQAQSGIQGLTVNGSTIYNTFSPFTAGLFAGPIAADHFSDVLIENTAIVNGGGNFDWGEGQAGTQVAVSGFFKLFYNTITSPLVLRDFAAAAAVTETGNIFPQGATCSTGTTTGGGPAPVSITANYNLWSSGGCGANDTTGSATLASSTRGSEDAHLQSGSAGVDVAQTSSCAVSTDVDSDSRPTGAKCDMGFDERTSP